SYNVQNLFDTTHDAGKDDYTYLPYKLKSQSPEIQNHCKSLGNDYWIKSCLETDWSEAALKIKLQNIAKVISSVNYGIGPDIILFQEVENKEILTRLVTESMKGYGYRYVSLLEGEDSRGIDVGVVSRFPIVSEKLHEVKLDGVAKPTRGILQVDIKLDNKTISVFSNHWPSQANPSMARYIAAQTLVEKALESKADAVVAAGDFNTIDGESPHGINLLVRPYFYTARDEAVSQGQWVFPGTHWYRGHWGSLDKLFVLKNGHDSIKPLYKTYEVFNRSWMLRSKKWTDYDTGVTKTHQVPSSYSPSNRQGYSDHLPLIMKFEY
ncbi:MAG: endonuclease/exonuclease/phosphatase family protein, partial [Bacteriovoracaceae bacterium]|nr:endonuclease/exonuclease/phosphatase family protein [Bacteriovoracaceae bacterium]